MGNLGPRNSPGYHNYLRCSQFYPLLEVSCAEIGDGPSYIAQAGLEHMIVKGLRLQSCVALPSLQFISHILSSCMEIPSGETDTMLFVYAHIHYSRDP